MVERGYGGVVCVSSISAILGQEAGSANAAGKAGLHGVVPSVAKEAARYGVNVNLVARGSTVPVANGGAAAGSPAMVYQRPMPADSRLARQDPPARGSGRINAL